jgi:cytochrome b pre-mRNA-processing protein 3
MFGKLFKGKKQNEIETQSFDLYCNLVEAARNPDLFIKYDIADTVDGRFDCISLHLGLFVRRLENEEGTKDLLETVLSAFISDMDRNLREMGVGDLSVGKQVKKMASAYQGRFVAYSKALDAQDKEALKNSLVRNLYRDGDVDLKKLEGMATYVLNYAAALTKTPTETLLACKLPSLTIS